MCHEVGQSTGDASLEHGKTVEVPNELGEQLLASSPLWSVPAESKEKK